MLPVLCARRELDHRAPLSFVHRAISALAVARSPTKRDAPQRMMDSLAEFVGVHDPPLRRGPPMDFSQVLAEANRGRGTITGKVFLGLLSEYIDLHSQALSAGRLRLTLNPPCVGYLSSVLQAPRPQTLAHLLRNQLTVVRRLRVVAQTPNDGRGCQLPLQEFADLKSLDMFDCVGVMVAGLQVGSGGGVGVGVGGVAVDCWCWCWDWYLLSEATVMACVVRVV